MTIVIKVEKMRTADDRFAVKVLVDGSVKHGKLYFKTRELAEQSGRSFANWFPQSTVEVVQS